MEIKSPAKINLFLHVVSKRPNGYHNLQSVFVKLNSLYDTIKIIESDDLKCNIVAGIPQEQNLVYKVAVALKKEFFISKGATITIDKKIPLGGGLGGGSSNAGVTLQALKRLWGINITDQELVDFAVKYGADIPFFIHSFTQSIVEGIGEIVKPCKIGKKLHLLLINPKLHIDTGIIFRQGFPEFTIPIDFNSNNLWLQIINSKNDLEKNAISFCPEIGVLLQEIKDAEGCILSRMTGSGSTCFGIFESKKEADNALIAFEKKWWVHYEEIDV